MGRLFHIYLPFVNAGTKEAAAYRVNFYFGFLGNLLGAFISFFLWYAIFQSSDEASFMGFSLTNMVVYVFLSFLTGYLTGSNVATNVGQDVKDGTIAMRLLKPTNFSMPPLFQEIGNKLMNTGFLFFPIIIGIEVYRDVVQGGIQFHIGYFLLYLLSCILAYLINYYFNLCFGFTAFVFQNLWGANMLNRVIVGFLSGSMIPLAFFPNGIQRVLELMPFASLIYTPVMIYMGKYEGSQLWIHLGLQVFWLLFFIGLSKLIWNAVSKRLSIQGG